MKKVFVICPVRNVTQEEKQAIENWVEDLESNGYQVHWPQRDTKQDGDPIGIRICGDNRQAIENADEVHVFWNPQSTGSLFDLGMTFALRKPVKIINTIEQTPSKSFNNVVKALGGELA
jgi:nucleoside 2-deoxyribosyltransferase